MTYYHVFSSSPEDHLDSYEGLVAQTVRPLTYSEARDLVRELRTEGRQALAISREELAKPLLAVPE